MSQEQARILKKARKLVEDPRNWTQRMYFGKHAPAGCVQSTRQEAECYCMQGAVLQAMDLPPRGVQTKEFRKVDNLLVESLGRFWGSTWVFNDSITTTHPMVLKAFDRAIARAEGS